MDCKITDDMIGNIFARALWGHGLRAEIIPDRPDASAVLPVIQTGIMIETCQDFRFKFFRTPVIAVGGAFKLDDLVMALRTAPMNSGQYLEYCANELAISFPPSAKFVRGDLRLPKLVTSAKNHTWENITVRVITDYVLAIDELVTRIDVQWKRF